MILHPFLWKAGLIWMNDESGSSLSSLKLV